MGAGGKAWLEHFTTNEIRELRAIRDHRAWLTVGVNYGLIAASMALVAYVPNVLTVVLALCVIGARQLGFAVVMHESAHHTLFKNLICARLFFDPLTCSISALHNDRG